MTTFPLISRIPTYAFGVLNEQKAQMQAQGVDFIDFGIGNPDQPANKTIKNELIRQIESEHSDAYGPSNGIKPLREAISQWYSYNYAVNLDAESEVIVTLGSKEGISHLALATVGSQDLVLIPDPCYPIHKYAFTIAGATVQSYDASDAENIVESIKQSLKIAWPKPKFLVLNFPSNPTAQCVDLSVFAKLVDLAKKENFWILQDLAYSDIVFEGERAASILQVPGAKEVAVESYTLSKSYNMPGWRVGFMCGNEQLVSALRHLKSYFDYGSYKPIQQAAVQALTGPQTCVMQIKELYRSRRDKLCASLAKIGWDVSIPKATMFVWAKIPEEYRVLGALGFAKALLKHAQVAVTPGSCFGENGNDYVRFSLIQSDAVVDEACARIDKMFSKKLGLDDVDSQMNVA